MQVQRSHADRLLGLADVLIERAGWPRSSVDAYVATRGPGSFTGVRVGLATVRGLALASDRPCLGITTFEALVEAHGPAERERIALVGAGRGELYGAGFDAASSPPEGRGAPWLRPSSDLFDVGGRGTLLVPAPGLESALPEGLRGRRGFHVAPEPRGIAAAAARVALLRGLTDGAEPDSIAPLYIRPPDAVLKPR
jgi:tRNA threonylcarbamoyladenosine biosynthesis protein TsaB